MTAPGPLSVTDLRPVGLASITLALGAGPAAWTVHLVASVALVPYACDTGREWPLHVITVVTAAVTFLGLGAALRLRRLGRTGPEGSPARARASFVATVSLYLGLLFLALIVLEGMLVLVLDPCQ